MRRLAGALVGISVSVGGGGDARAERPTYAPGSLPTSFAPEDGRVRVHYAALGDDAAPAADVDGSGVPDFVEEVAAAAEASLVHLIDELGFRPPLGDGALPDDGGDARLDIYLRNLIQADGQFVVEDCTDVPLHCAGHVVMENDFAGYPYPSPSVGIQVLTSHELFHAIQAAYDADQPQVWSEGSAVWAEERVFPEQDDFERLVGGFLARPQRPFERTGLSFGDPYPYGAALWPYYLEHRFGLATVRRVWEACEATVDDAPGFLDASAAVLAEHGASLEEAWIEFALWNAATGGRAGDDGYPDAGRLADAAREDALRGGATATLTLEGMSARYLPLALPDGRAATVTVRAVGRVAAAALRAGDALPALGEVAAATDHELAIPAGDGAVDLALVGVVRGTPAQPLEVTLRVAPAPLDGDGDGDDDGGGCAVAGGGARPGPGGALLPALAVLAIAVARRAPAPRG